MERPGSPNLLTFDHLRLETFCFNLFKEKNPFVWMHMAGRSKKPSNKALLAPY